MSDILNEIDAAIEDAEGYVEWHGSDDAAEWHADGSHEPAELHGDYYAYDRGGLMEYAPYTIDWREQRDALLARMRQSLARYEAEDEAWEVAREWRPNPALIEAMGRAIDAHVIWGTTSRQLMEDISRDRDVRGLFRSSPVDDVAEAVASWPLEPASDRPFVTVERELQAARTEMEPSW